jgi:hypothetical protein
MVTLEYVMDTLKINSEKENEVSNVLGKYQKEWDNTEYDTEESIPEQEIALDKVVNDCVAELQAIK